MHSLRTSCHLLQPLPQPALPEVSSRGARPLARSASPGASPDTVRPCCLHAASRAGTTGLAEQEGHLRSSVSRQCRNTSRSRSRSETPRRRDWLLQCVAYLESKAPTSPACPLRGSLPADSPLITPTGSKLATPSFFPSRCSVASFVASLLRLSSAPFATANYNSMETWRPWLSQRRSPRG